MALIEELRADSIQALKGGDSFRLETIRFLLSGIHNAEIEKRTQVGEGDLTDEEVVSVLNKEAKKRKEAIEIYAGAGRKDLEEKETRELEIIKSYLPKELTAAEIESVIDKALAARSDSETRRAGPKPFGEIMKEVMKEVAGRADSKTVSDLVKEKLEEG